MVGHGFEAWHAGQRGNAFLRQSRDRAPVHLPVKPSYEQRTLVQLQRCMHPQSQIGGQTHIGGLMPEDAGQQRAGAPSDLVDIVLPQVHVRQGVVQVLQWSV